MDKLQWVRDELNALRQAGKYVPIRALQSPQGAWVVIGGRKLLNLCSNNYLGYANHPEVKRAAQEAIGKYGVGAGAVRSIAGTTELHEQLEREVAEFKNAEAALVYQGGLLANLGTIPVLVGKGDLVFSEELNHASIIDGVRLSSATRFVYRHSDMEDLRKQLEENRKAGRRSLVVTDGVFSMDGEIAPLPEIADLAGEFDSMVYVDDAHGEGVLGDHGRGIVDHFHLSGKVDVEMGTFSKATGSIGGFVAGPSELIELLKQKARPFLFSSALNPGDAAAVMRSIQLMRSDDSPLRRLWSNSDALKSGLKKNGFDTGRSQTPITPVMLMDERRTLEFSRMLYAEEGVFASPIVYPTVPQGKARIRLIPSAVHSHDDIRFAVDAFVHTGQKLGLI
ncbi:MAG: glycine C-acetyltransferase [Thermoplasmata archaeon]|uniref:Glycine C-acetyltransferase n=1 Tax=Candidatus Sysuiplasma superficiale TaxID=2823368 RepID=A0A8J8CAS5_9ARCH|nr:glycine C-acetyltransferase [Candidatus Sysuiplasma superficiale]MBX8644286.1 glycine C-acetyltransferase [Candidatus Sysuiplasma superficiale]